MISSVLAAAVGTVAFSLIFGVPRRYYPYCAVIGGAGWLLYLVLTRWCSQPEAIFYATVLVVILSRLAAVKMRCPVTIFLVSGIFSLVPGAQVYWTSYYIVTNELEQAAETGFLAIKSAVAIVLGIVFVFQLPQRVFRICQEKKVGDEGNDID